jgi:hypothetical protein
MPILQMGIGVGPKVAIQPTPGAIRKQPQMKPKQRKSRTGCMTCKAKRLKCDEKKVCTVPLSCSCSHSAINVQRKAYNARAMRKISNGRVLKTCRNRKRMRPYEERVHVPSTPRKHAKSAGGKRLDDDDYPDSIADQDFKQEYALSPSEMMPPPNSSVQFNSSFPNHLYSGSPAYDGFILNGFTNGFLSSNSPRPNLFASPRSDNASPMSIASLLNEDNSPHSFFTNTQFGSPPKKETANKPDVLAIPASPRTIPLTRTPPPIPFIHPIYPEYEFHDSDESEKEEEEEDIEDIYSQAEDSLGLIRSPKRRRLNSYIPGDAASLHLPLAESRMWNFYTKVTSTILSCKNADGENPWRDDLVQRAMESDALKHALFAMTSFHLKRHMPEEEWSMANYGLSHTNLSFQALRKVLNDGVAFDENNIAAMLVLSFSQVSSVRITLT